MSAVRAQKDFEFSFIDPFGRARDIELTLCSDGFLHHESGRIYAKEGRELRLAGSYNEPVFNSANLKAGCRWIRSSSPTMFETRALLGHVTGSA